MPQNTNIKNDHDALLERIAIAIEEKTGASPDEQTDRKSASGAMLERIAEAIENGNGGGSSGGGMVIGLSLDGERVTMDKTFTEIKNALENGAYVVAKWRNEDEAITVEFYPVISYFILERANRDAVMTRDAVGNTYSVSVGMHGDEMEFFTNSVDGYPSAIPGPAN